MAKLVLNHNDWEDESTTHLKLSLIHSPTEDYRLAFLLNKHCLLNFRASTDLILNNQTAINHFCVFYSKLTTDDFGVFLIGNHSFKTDRLNAVSDLFSTQEITRSSLLSKHAKWDYFLLCKDEPLLEILNSNFLNKHISAAHVIDFETLKQSEQAALTALIYENEH
jgi:hypothetical protein